MKDLVYNSPKPHRRLSTSANSSRAICKRTLKLAHTYALMSHLTILKHAYENNSLNAIPFFDWEKHVVGGGLSERLRKGLEGDVLEAMIESVGDQAFSGNKISIKMARMW
jgi:hypothetical protein